jgi:hypothetical protein
MNSVVFLCLIIRSNIRNGIKSYLISEYSKVPDQPITYWFYIIKTLVSDHYQIREVLSTCNLRIDPLSNRYAGYLYKKTPSFKGYIVIGH